MVRTYIKDLKEKIGKDVTVKGFVQSIRNQGGIKFLILRDVTGIIQCVVMKSDKEAFGFVEDLSLESVVSIEGLVKEEKQAPDGFEVQVKSIEILSKAYPELPIPVVYEKSGDETDVTKRLDYRWLDLRRPEHLQIFKVWTELEKGFRKFCDENNFVQIYTPSFMIAPSESGSEVFEVEYFDRKAYLAQSPQFYKQMALASGFDRVFMAGPVFRAEPSFTTRHMTEFTGWDFEMAYVDSHHDVMDLLEGAIVAGFSQIRDSLDIDIVVPSRPFPRLTMAEAKEKLSSRNVPSKAVFDVSPEEERILCEIVKEETNHDFVFLTDWPVEGRPFYHMRYEGDQKTTKSYDLLYRGLEIVTGAQREHRHDVLVRQAEEKKMNLNQLKDYLEFFRYGCPPHGGAGIGPGRIIMMLLDLSSVKEATFLPRDVKRLRP
ncbi:aspartate--tRNA(Asn) ligase [Patescibacteria group bacterium]|nr:aspartate--tRNA(Asn) ligase [Patescibacteria group bacterium]